MDKVLILVIIAAMVLFVILKAKQLRNTRCEKCGGEMRFDELHDPIGTNIAKKYTFSYYQAARKYSEKWKCKDCARIQIVKY